MKKTHVEVTVQFQGNGPTPFQEVIDECDYYFKADQDTNAEVVDTNIVEVVKIDGAGFVTVDLLIHHDDDNIDEILQEMDYDFQVSEDHIYKIIDTEITSWTITDSR